MFTRHRQDRRTIRQLKKYLSIKKQDYPYYTKVGTLLDTLKLAREDISLDILYKERATTNSSTI